MRALFIVGTYLIAFWMPAHAATIAQDIADAEKLNGLCRGSSSDLVSTDMHCKKRDAAYAALEKRGWCWGREGQAGYEMKWEPCIKNSASEPLLDQEASLPNGYGVAVVGLAPINDGTVHMLVLSLSPVGSPPIPTFCGDGWLHGLIKSAYKSRGHNNAMIDFPGCWSLTSENLEIAKIKFRYYSLDPAMPGVKEFTARAKRFERMILNKSTGEVFFASGGRP